MTIPADRRLSATARQSWHDVVTSQRLGPATAEVTDACGTDHRSPESAYRCGAARLRRLAHVDHQGRADALYAALSLTVTPRVKKDDLT